MFTSLICRVSGHKINRRRVWHDSVDFRTACDRCGVALIREQHLGWRPYEDERDHLDVRKEHPHAAHK